MRWLTPRGWAAAVAVGLATVYGFGWRGFILLLAFLVSSSLLSSRRTSRNERQVVANGGVAALAALLGNWPAFAGSIAAATADTWATEIGRRSPTPPRLVTTWTTVAPGTDGGMTLLGTLGGIAGAGFIAGTSSLLGFQWVLGVALAGTLGMVLDSILGATVQGKVRWMDNDVVNLAATLTGAVLSGLLK